MRQGQLDPGSTVALTGRRGAGLYRPQFTWHTRAPFALQPWIFDLESLHRETLVCGPCLASQRAYAPARR